MPSLLRTTLERLSRDVVLKKRMGTDFGAAPLLVSPDACLSYWKPGLRSDLFDFAREFVKPGDTVWDVGANVGLFSVAAAQRATHLGRVVAVEVDIWLAGLLGRSALMQSKDSAPILVVPAAASDQLGLLTFNIAKRGRASNYLDATESSLQSGGGSSVAGGVRQQVPALGITLDWILDLGVPAPNVLKIDVEGAELPVLLGAGRVLSEARPVILCEVWSKYGKHTAVTALFAKHNYELYDGDSKPRNRTDVAVFNTLAIPKT